MPFFEVRNQQNAAVILIDDTFSNLEFRGKGTGSATAQWEGTRSRFGTVTVTGATDPMIAVASSTACLMLARVNNGGGSFTFTLLFNVETNAAFEYFIFDTPSTTASGPGLTLKDADDRVTYYSGNRYMRVAALLAGEGGVSVNLPAGRAHAILMGLGGLRLAINSGGSPTPGWYLEIVDLSGTFARIAGTTAATERTTLRNIRNEGQGGQGPNAPSGIGGTTLVRHLVVDVTGY